MAANWRWDRTSWCRSCRGAIQLRRRHPDFRAAGARGRIHSIHIEEFEIEARDTKLGKEEITRDIPNISEVYLSNLDESGIITSAPGQAGDIRGRHARGETQRRRKRRLRAIFGEKSAVPRRQPVHAAGHEGTVVDVNVLRAAARTGRAHPGHRERHDLPDGKGSGRPDPHHPRRVAQQHLDMLEGKQRRTT